MTACWKRNGNLPPKVPRWRNRGVVPLDAGADAQIVPQKRESIYQLHVLEKSERETSVALHLAQTTFRQRKKALLEKLRTLLDKNS